MDKLHSIILVSVASLFVFCGCSSGNSSEKSAVSATTNEFVMSTVFKARYRPDDADTKSCLDTMQAEAEHSGLAAFGLALCHENGWLVEKSRATAASWYMKSLELGHTDAGRKLLEMLNAPDGLPYLPENIIAVMAIQGDRDAQGIHAWRIASGKMAGLDNKSIEHVRKIMMNLWHRPSYERWLCLRIWLGLVKDGDLFKPHPYPLMMDEQSKIWFMRAADQGDCFAMDAIVSSYFALKPRGNNNDYVYLRASLDSGTPWATTMIADESTTISSRFLIRYGSINMIDKLLYDANRGRGIAQLWLSMYHGWDLPYKLYPLIYSRDDKISSKWKAQAFNAFKHEADAGDVVSLYIHTLLSESSGIGAHNINAIYDQLSKNGVGAAAARLRERGVH